MLHDVNTSTKDLKTTLDKVPPTCKKFEAVIHEGRAVLTHGQAPWLSGISDPLHHFWAPSSTKLAMVNTVLGCLLKEKGGHALVTCQTRGGPGDFLACGKPPGSLPPVITSPQLPPES